MPLFFRFPTKTKKAILAAVLTVFSASALIAAEAGVQTKPLLQPAPDLKNSPAFQTLLKKESRSKVYELLKVEYLLERITRSSCIFVRNRENHKGRVAVMHMRWKYKRYESEVETAEDFVNKIANGSRKTNETYRIKMADGTIYKSKDILTHELEFLNQALKEARSHQSSGT